MEAPLYTKQAISARERALYQLTECFEFQSRGKRRQEFSRIVLCHQLWLKTEADEIRKDKNYAG